MKRRAIILLMIASAAHADAPGTAAWLVGGYWIALPSTSEDHLCDGTDAGTIFDGNGTYGEFEEGGRWRLDGDRLRRTVTWVQEEDGGRRGDIGHSRTTRIERLDANRYRETGPNGASEIYIRCPAR